MRPHGTLYRKHYVRFTLAAGADLPGVIPGFIDPVFDIRNGLDPRPDPTVGTVTSDLEPELATFFSNVSYKGAFSPTATNLWTEGWSVASGLGVLALQN